jgi:hypothetical protein
MKIKTSELTGAALDWAVAVCEHNVGWEPEGEDRDYYSTDWAHGGPIIEREKIGTAYARGCWAAHPDRADYPNCDTPYFFGQTPLIAAMCCYVASKLGDTIDIPEELTT